MTLPHELHEPMPSEMPEIAPCIYAAEKKCAHLQCVIVEMTRAIAALKDTITELTDVVRGWR